MSQTITLELPDELVRSARALAHAANRTLEETVMEWIRNAVEDPPLTMLSDEALKSLCALQMDQSRQAELSQLLAQQREGPLPAADQNRLDALMAEYRRGLVLKARAIKVSVDRGLHPVLDGNGT
jgi:predicted transcriptional regulator